VTATTKAEIRAMFRSMLASIEPETAETWSIAVCGHLQRWWCEQQGREARERGKERGSGVMVYAPMVGAGEVDVSLFAQWVLDGEPDGVGGRAGGSVVAVPRVDWVGGVMSAVAISSWSRDLVEDQVRRRLGLRVPRSDLPAVDASRLGLIVVPGLAFDRSGARLGRGAGFYDRFLAELPPPPIGPTVIGAAFDVQIIEGSARLPIEPHDVRVHAIATESGVHQAVHPRRPT